MTARCHTYTGTGFDPFNPHAEDVRLEDIAHALAQICRYGGHTPTHYSVAQHAVHVAETVWDLLEDPVAALHALHHDSAEAYLGDVRRPLKQAILMRYSSVKRWRPEGWEALLPFEDLEEQVLAVVTRGLGIPDVLDEVAFHTVQSAIKNADNSMLKAELEGLFGESAYWVDTWIQQPPMVLSRCMPWREAKQLFLAAHSMYIDRLAATVAK